MRKKRKKHGYGWVLLTSWLMIGGVYADEARWPIQTFGARAWYVDWTFGGLDLGGAPVLMLNYTADYNNWQMQVLGGYGSGWSKDVTDDFLRGIGVDPAARKRSGSEADRLDLQWQLGRRIRLDRLRDEFNITAFRLPTLFAGVGYQYIEFDFKSAVTEAEVFYHGPGLMLGFSQALFVDGLFARGNVTWLPYIRWSTDSSRLDGVGGTDKGSTDGLTYDVGLAYQTLLSSLPLHVAGGYRNVTAKEDGLFIKDTFEGGYVELGMHW